MTEPAPHPAKSHAFHITFNQLAGAALCLMLCGGGYHYGYEAYNYEKTDDATVEGRHTLLAPKVPGIVTKVLFEDNQEVHANQALVEIDPRDYQNMLGVNKAELQAVQANLKDAALKFHESEALLKSGAINSQRKDTDEARYFALQAEAVRLQRRIDQNKVDLDYATLRAPLDGKVGRRAVEPGMYANAGQALVSFVTARERWIVANFKETQLARMKVGSRAEVRVDAIPERIFEGTVQSASPTSGAVFSLMPPDNATGNYIKIVQRVPVKIVFNALSDEDVALLQVGLNADVRILAH